MEPINIDKYISYCPFCGKTSSSIRSFKINKPKLELNLKIKLIKLF